MIELLRRGAELTWLRTPNGYEIDFVARFPDGEIELIQVSANLENADTVKREARALTDAGNIFPKARLRLLTLDHESRLHIPTDSGIEVTAVYEWLLG